MVLAAGKIQNSSPGVYVLTRSYRRYLSLPAPDGKSPSHYMRTDSLSNTALQQGGTLLILSLYTHTSMQANRKTHTLSSVTAPFSAVVQLFMFYCNICVWTFHVIKTKLFAGCKALHNKNYFQKYIA